MVAKQLSIFLENKSGRLTEVTEVLAKEGINLSALCIAENADFGILRGIVSDPDKAYKALKDKIPVGIFFYNSLVVSVLGMVFQILTCSLAAYAVVFIEFKGKKGMYLLIKGEFPL